jgi:hypothetical protein
MPYRSDRKGSLEDEELNKSSINLIQIIFT